MKTAKSFNIQLIYCYNPFSIYVLSTLYEYLHWFLKISFYNILWKYKNLLYILIYSSYLNSELWFEPLRLHIYPYIGNCVIWLWCIHFAVGKVCFWLINYLRANEFRLWPVQLRNKFLIVVGAVEWYICNCGFLLRLKRRGQVQVRFAMVGVEAIIFPLALCNWNIKLICFRCCERPCAHPRHTHFFFFFNFFYCVLVSMRTCWRNSIETCLSI